MDDDADDRLKIRRTSPGPAQAFALREPVLTRVSRIPAALRSNPIFKLEHGCRPSDVDTVYACPIFRESHQWQNDNPDTREEPFAVFVMDASEDLALKLIDPLIEDRMASLAQLIGEQLKGHALTVAGNPPTSTEMSLPSWASLDTDRAFNVSPRKSRSLIQDDAMIDVAKLAESRIRAA
jgi:hypothetical protein